MRDRIWIAALLAILPGACAGEIGDGAGGAAGTSLGGDGGTATSGNGGTTSTGAGGSSAAGKGGTGSSGKGGTGSSGKGGTGSSGKGGTGSSGKGGSAGTGGSSSGTGGTTAGTGGTTGCTPNTACRPTPPASTGNPYDDCVARINQFRACMCLPPLERWTAGEACADQDVAYDRSRNSPHAGFIGKICSPQGSGENECLGGAVNNCLQNMFDEGPPPPGPCDKACFDAHGHFINMTNRSFTRVACGFDGNWAVQNFQ
jgi:hypothetical protein